MNLSSQKKVHNSCHQKVVAWCALAPQGRPGAWDASENLALMEDVRLVRWTMAVIYF